MVRLGRGARRGAPLAAAVLGAILVACGNTVPLHTATGPVQACDGAITSGRLTNNRPNGLALQAPDGATTLVLWPFGYSTRGFVGSMELVDDQGRVIAREGDNVEVGGGMGGDGFFAACAGTIRVVPPGG